jgi:hypothetical protein
LVGWSLISWSEAVPNTPKIIFEIHDEVYEFFSSPSVPVAMLLVLKV